MNSESFMVWRSRALMDLYLKKIRHFEVTKEELILYIDDVKMIIKDPDKNVEWVKK